MRTSPLPNRHAADLADFVELIQATLNENRHKGDLHDMSFEEITDKVSEEGRELMVEMVYQRQPERFGVQPDAEKVQREAADVAICALMAFMWARKERGE